MCRAQCQSFGEGQAHCSISGPRYSGFRAGVSGRSPVVEWIQRTLCAVVGLPSRRRRRTALNSPCPLWDAENRSLGLIAKTPYQQDLCLLLIVIACGFNLEPHSRREAPAEMWSLTLDVEVQPVCGFTVLIPSSIRDEQPQFD